MRLSEATTTASMGPDGDEPAPVAAPRGRLVDWMDLGGLAAGPISCWDAPRAGEGE